MVRDIRLIPDAIGTNFSSRVSGGHQITGNYAETIHVLGLDRGTNAPTDVRNFEVRGVFRLDRISNIPVLTSSPPTQP